MMKTKHLSFYASFIAATIYGSSFLAIPSALAMEKPNAIFSKAKEDDKKDQKKNNNQKSAGTTTSISNFPLPDEITIDQTKYYKVVSNATRTISYFEKTATGNYDNIKMHFTLGKDVLDGDMAFHVSGLPDKSGKTSAGYQFIFNMDKQEGPKLVTNAKKVNAGVVNSVKSIAGKFLQAIGLKK